MSLSRRHFPDWLLPLQSWRMDALSIASCNLEFCCELKNVWRCSSKGRQDLSRQIDTGMGSGNAPLKGSERKLQHVAFAWSSLSQPWGRKPLVFVVSGCFFQRLKAPRYTFSLCSAVASPVSGTGPSCQCSTFTLCPAMGWKTGKCAGLSAESAFPRMPTHA